MTDEEAAAEVKNWCIRNESKKNRDNQGQRQIADISGNKEYDDSG